MEIGSTLNQYRVTGMLGVGGMGEVYRAEDTRLKREAAIKVLPASLAADPERVARMEREAQLLAALNHPHIAGIYGLDEAVLEDGTSVRFLAMELVEGETVADRLAAGPLKVDKAIAIALQLAAGLEAAHEKGIVHRDLKPANVQLGEDDRVKILDFGLAKAYDTDGSASSLSPELTASPTLLAGTQAGVILGTAAYMSPEQARGKPVDKRTDIWAFGCVLYEMLVGHKTYDGETVTDVIAAIVTREPDLDALPQATPPRLRELLGRCLIKDPRERVRDIGDARIELEHAHDEPIVMPPGASAAAAPRPAWLAAALLVAGLAVGAIAATVLRPEPSRPVRHVRIPTTGAFVEALAVSPDGSAIVYRGAAGPLLLQRLSEASAVPIPGTERGSGPAFGVDGESLFFVAPGGLLRRVQLGGGAPLTVAELEAGDWLFIRVIDENRLRAVGGVLPNVTFQEIDLRDGSRTELFDLGPATHEGRVFLPMYEFADQGAHLGMSVVPARVIRIEEARVEVYWPESGERRVLLEGFVVPRITDWGELLAVDKDGGLFGVDFNSWTLELEGGLKQRAEGLAVAAPVAFYNVTDDGSLFYVAGEAVDSAEQLIWLDRAGGQNPVSDKRADYNSDSRISANGRFLALERDDMDGLWIHDLERDTQTPLLPGAQASFPVWSPDGLLVAASIIRPEEPHGIFLVPADRSGAPQRLTSAAEGRYHLVMDWSSDGHWILYVDAADTFRAAGADLWIVDAAGGSEPRPFLTTGAHENEARFSPNGRYIAYESDHSGRVEVYVRRADGSGGEIPISADGGSKPLWNPADDELFFVIDRRMMVVDIDTDENFTAGVPRELFTFPAGVDTALSEPDTDGERFLTYGSGIANAQSHLAVIFNWAATLER